MLRTLRTSLTTAGLFPQTGSHSPEGAKATITLPLRSPPTPTPTPSYVHIPTSNPFALLPLDVTPPSPPDTNATLNPTHTKNTSYSTNITNPTHLRHPNVSPSTPSPVKGKRDAVTNNQPNKRANRLPKAKDFTASRAIKVIFVAPMRMPSDPNPTWAKASSPVAPPAQLSPLGPSPLDRSRTLTTCRIA